MLGQTDPGAALVWAAYIAAIPATVMSFAAWRNAAASKKQTAPSNGSRLAETVEKTSADVVSLKQDLAYHVTVQHGRGPVPTQEK